MIRKRWLVDKTYKDTSIGILSANLAPLRVKAGITQEEISNIIGTSRQTYYAIETGKKEMSWGTYMALVLLFHELDATKDMVDDLRVYPIDMFMRFNETLPDEFEPGGNSDG